MNIKHAIPINELCRTTFIGITCERRQSYYSKKQYKTKIILLILRNAHEFILGLLFTLDNEQYYKSLMYTKEYHKNVFLHKYFWTLIYINFLYKLAIKENIFEVRIFLKLKKKTFRTQISHKTQNESHTISGKICS